MGERWLNFGRWRGGFALFSAEALVVLILMGVNDHFFKYQAIGTIFTPVTGILSDICAALLLPLFFEFFISLILERKRALQVAVLLTVLILALLEMSPLFMDFYKWIHDLVLADFGMRSKLVADYYDLLAIPFVGLSYRWGLRKQVAAP